MLGDGSQTREEKLALELIFVCTRTHEAAVTAISFSADGHQMFTGDARGTVIMWGKDRKSGACLHDFSHSCPFSPTSLHPSRSLALCP